MDPIRPTSEGPWRGPLRGPFAGTAYGPAGLGSGGHGRQQPREEEPKPRAREAQADGTPRRRGSVPHRAGDDLARAAEAVDAALAAGDPLAEAYAALLARLALDPEGDGEALRALTGPGAVPLRVALLAAAAHLRAPDLEPRIDALAEHMLGALMPTESAARALPGAARSEQAAVLRAAVQEGLREVARMALKTDVGTEVVGVGRAFLVQIAELFIERCDRALGRGAAGAAGAAGVARLALTHALRARDRGQLAAQLTAPVLGALLALPKESPLRAALADCAFAALNTGAADARIAALVEAALAPDAAAPRALAQLVGALEAEASSNAARREQGEPAWWTLALRDGDAWTTAQLCEDPRAGAARIALGLELSALDAVRVDLALVEGRLIVRLVAEEPTTAALLRASLEDLRSDLLDGAHDVLVAIAESVEAEGARVAPPPTDVDHLDING
ncbi:MAG: flagellar hook-length control protein FliK [Planctomycetota bacterium]